MVTYFKSYRAKGMELGSAEERIEIDLESFVGFINFFFLRNFLLLYFVFQCAVRHGHTVLSNTRRCRLAEFPLQTKYK